MLLAIAQLNPTIGDFQGNVAKIVAAIEEAKKAQCDLVLFSELVIPGYPPEDLLLVPDFIQQCDAALEAVIDASRGIALVVGTVRRSTKGSTKPLHNTAAIIEDRQLIGFQDKCLLPTYDVFDEWRYFEPSCSTQTWTLAGKNVGITICEDIWKQTDRLVLADYKVDPVARLAPLKPQILFNLSSSPYSFKKLHVRKEVLARTASHLNVPAILCNQVGGNDSLIFDGNSMIANAQGTIVHKCKSFAEDLVIVETDELGSEPIEAHDDLYDLYHALVTGLRDYFAKSGFKKAALGLSGGVDSALVACIAAEALGPHSVVGLVMPSRYTSEESVIDAEKLAVNLDIQTVEVPIETVFKTYEALLAPYFEGHPPDVTEENLQARIRGQILMAFSNKLGHLILSTGNKSEMAMGYATLYGDMCGGLSVINDVSKLQVYALCRWINDQGKEIVPSRIITKAPSAELAPNQKDSDNLPDYAIIDMVLEEYVERHNSPEQIAKKHALSLEVVTDLVGRIHRNEYKRRQSPPGFRVTEKAFSVGRRFPIVQRWR